LVSSPACERITGPTQAPSDREEAYRRRRPIHTLHVIPPGPTSPAGRPVPATDRRQAMTKDMDKRYLYHAVTDKMARVNADASPA